MMVRARIVPALALGVLLAIAGCQTDPQGDGAAGGAGQAPVGQDEQRPVVPREER